MPVFSSSSGGIKCESGTEHILRIKPTCHRVGPIKVALPGDNPLAKHIVRQLNPHVSSLAHARRSRYQHPWLRRGRCRGRRYAPASNAVLDGNRCII